MRRCVTFLSAALLVSSLAYTCGNFEFAPTFVPRALPGVPLQKFLAGDIGILQGSFLHFYQFIAYRHWTGLGLNPDERAALPSGRFATSDARPETGLEVWTRTRDEIRPGSPIRDYETYRKILGEGWNSYLNCTDHAFRTAAETLGSRVAKFGPDSREVKLWLDAQDQVFSNCGAGETIPESLPPDVDPLIRADRDYQIAAAYFYAGEFDEAARRFEAIARDTSSPWSVWGTYLAARCDIRKGNLARSYNEFDGDLLRSAQSRLQEVLRDPRLQPVHEAAKGLLDYLRLRLDPADRMRELSLILTTPNTGERIRQAWIDYDYLLDRGQKVPLDDLGLWMTVLRGQPAEALAKEDDSREIALRRWRDTGTVHWLFAALSLADAKWPPAGQLNEAAAQVPPGDPAYLGISFHRIRLALENGQTDAARRDLDTLLENPDLEIPAGSRNQFLAQRFSVSRSLDEALRFAARRPLSLSFVGSEQGPEWYLDEDALDLFNRELPLSMLEESVHKEILPEEIRWELALSVWLRAALTGQTATALRLAGPVQEWWPELAGDLKAYRESQTPEERNFALTYLLLRHPGLRPHLRESLHRRGPLSRIDNLRENWWCRISPGVPLHASVYWGRQDSSGRVYSEADEILPAPTFLTQAQREAAQKEFSRISEIPSGPSYLCRQTLEWAESHRQDPRVPEALHLAVRATRYGCEDQDNTRWSRRAFRFLHRHYPETPWAKTTKYYY